MLNHFNKAQIARSFSRAAPSYNHVNVLQQKVGSQLLQQLGLKGSPTTILDLGCGTGILTAKLAQVFPQAQVIGIDIAANMVQHARQAFGQRENLNFWEADSDYLPMANDSIDLIVSNLMLQWSPDIKATLAEWLRVLKPQGQLLLATIGQGSLKELRQAWLKIDNYPHVSNFISKEQLLEALTFTQFHCIQLMHHSHYRFFATVYDLMLELKMLGAHNLHENRCKGLLGKNKLKNIQLYYDKYKGHKHKLPASFEIYYVNAFKAKP